jgi:hypothetical protein
MSNIFDNQQGINIYPPSDLFYQISVPKLCAQITSILLPKSNLSKDSVTKDRPILYLRQQQ